jgi:class 3 adenylate cyclase/tetratricopeptide (TPR) repeat protein
MPFLEDVSAACRSVPNIRKFWADRAVWQVQLTDDFSPASAVYADLTRAATRFGENLLALEIALDGRETLSAFRASRPVLVEERLDDLEYEKAIALSRLGSVGEAREILLALHEKRPENAAILSAIGRTFKDLALAATHPPILASNLDKAHSFYLRAFELSGAYYPAINAATVALWQQNRDTACDLAERVKELCRAVLQKDPEDYWAAATIAEAELVLSIREGAVSDTALSHYQRASTIAHHLRHWGDLSSTRRQAKRICEFAGWDSSSLQKIFGLPNVIIFSGHMIDTSRRLRPRFPPLLVPAVATEIKERLHQCDAQIGISSAACGSDLLFIEAMLERGAEIHVVLPWRKEEFLRTSVAINDDVYWTQRFDQLLNEVTSVTYLSQQSAPSGNLGYVYCSDCMNGMALYRAETIGSDVTPVAVWDGKKGDGLGGTSSFVHFWRSRHHPVEVIDLSRISGISAIEAPQEDQAFAFDEVKVSQGQQAVKTLLFADVVGYSKIPEEQIEYFAPEFLGMISQLISQPPRPVLTNTWGDAVYLVFDDPVSAGTVALRLLRAVQSGNWRTHLTAKMDLRIGLHTGPVTLCVDPVIRQITFTGSHVSHAARIEPMVREGEVWATEAFMSYATIANHARKQRGEETLEFGFDYLGQIDFAKRYGRYPLFRLSSPITNRD